MAEIGKLPPAWRIDPTRPSSGTGRGNQPPRRKPDTEEHEPEHRRKKDRDGDDKHIDEYA